MRCISLTGETLDASVYSNAGFHGLCSLEDGTVLGLKDDGVYMLVDEAVADDEFQTGVIMPKTDFQSHNDKRLHLRGFVRPAAPDVLMTAGLDGEEPEEVFYSSDNGEIPFGHPQQGYAFEIRIAGFSELRALEFQLAQVAR